MTDAPRPAPANSNPASSNPADAVRTNPVPPKSDDPANDPRGLIAEAYRMADLTAEAARAIFFDWALGRSGGEGRPEAIAALHARYAAAAPDHPMTAVLAEGLTAAARAPARRGGRAGRRS
ncbi:MAG: hypothetical protein VYD87_09530 [Pseudomonadota bacterium]|nr:hypothetical protein [Pseudomonadota bacterium]MEE3100793.1 hypothetical protein [Pseudomonadota bacterium]